MALDSKSSFSMGCSKNLLHAMHERINVTVFFCDSVTCKRIKAGPCLSYCKQKSTISSHTPISPFPPLFPFVNKTVKDFDWTMHGWAILGRIASSSLVFFFENRRHFHYLRRSLQSKARMDSGASFRHIKPAVWLADLANT